MYKIDSGAIKKAVKLRIVIAAMRNPMTITLKMSLLVKKRRNKRERDLKYKKHVAFLCDIVGHSAWHVDERKFKGENRKYIDELIFIGGDEI